MKVYAFEAALLCECCGERRIEQVRARGGVDNGCSTQFPQGPYSDGGGEADSPQHCDLCGVFLENTLTPDGDAYVRAQLAELGESDCDDTATLAEKAGKPTLAEWFRFYYSYGE